jgi:plastocyanin
MTTRNTRWIAALLIGALQLAACGGSDDGGTADGGDAGVTAFSVQAADFTFTPDTWGVAADENVTITLDNAGTLEHNWVILTEGTKISSEAEISEDAFLFDFGSVNAGESASKTFNVPGGTYQVICTISGHFGAGMEGTLTVG